MRPAIGRARCAAGGRQRIGQQFDTVPIEHATNGSLSTGVMPFDASMSLR